MPTLPAFAQGDFYFRNRGPDVPIAKEDPPPRPEFCTEFGGSEERRDCFLGVEAGRIWAAQYGGMKGWESGYLTGYAWALYIESRTYSEEVSFRREGAASATGLKQFKDAITKERDEILVSARAAGAEAAQKLLDDAFESGSGIPETTLADDSIPVGSYDPAQDPYSKYVGTDISRKAILTRFGAKTISPFRTTSFELVTESNAPEFQLLEFVFDDGVYKTDASDQYDTAKSMEVWRHSKFAPAENANVNRQLEEQGFTSAYKHYIKYNYAKDFYRGLDLGTEHGLPLGKKLGERMAFLQAQRDAFNKRFSTQMVDIHRKAKLQGYRQGWEKTVADAKQPILKLVDVTVYGEVDDGVVSPGEKVGFRGRVENRGLVGLDQAAVSIAGPVAKSIGTSSIEVAAFKTVPLDTGIIAILNPKAKPRQKAKLLASLGPEKVPIETMIHSVVELDDFRVETLELAQSKATVIIVAKSQSTRTADEITVALAMDGKLQARETIGSVAAGQSAEKSIALSTLDPIAFNPNKSALQVRLYQGKKVLDGRAVPMKISEPVNELAKYYDYLANGEGYVPKGKTREQRIVELETRLIGMSKGEIRKNAGSLTNLWKNKPETTIPGRILKYRRAESDSAKQQYARLGEGLCALDVGFTKIQSKKKKTYRELCERVRDGK